MEKTDSSNLPQATLAQAAGDSYPFWALPAQDLVSSMSYYYPRSPGFYATEIYAAGHEDHEANSGAHGPGDCATGPRAYAATHEVYAADSGAYCPGSCATGPGAYPVGPEVYAADSGAYGPGGCATGPRAYAAGPKGYAADSGAYCPGDGLRAYATGLGSRDYAAGPEVHTGAAWAVAPHVQRISQPQQLVQHRHSFWDDDDDATYLTLCAYLRDVLQVGDQNHFRPADALQVLSEHREKLPNLAPVLWSSYGTLVVLVSELIHVYPQLKSPTTMTNDAWNRACNSLALMQSLAAHPGTKSLFLEAGIPLLIYPLLNMDISTPGSGFLRLTAMGVIGALVKTDNREAIDTLLRTEILPLCLRIMENGAEMERIVAAFIVLRFLDDDYGLSYICHTPERFYAVASALAKMVDIVRKVACSRLLKIVIGCYLRLSDNLTAREVLKRCLPDSLWSDQGVEHLPLQIRRSLKGDPKAAHLLQNLLGRLNL